MFRNSLADLGSIRYMQNSYSAVNNAMEAYFANLPKHAPLPLRWNTIAEPPTKRPKQGPGSRKPMKIHDPKQAEVRLYMYVHMHGILALSTHSKR